MNGLGPRAQARLCMLPNDHIFQWRLIRCPFCGASHHHEAGAMHIVLHDGHGHIVGAPHAFLGPREAPCGGGTYSLLEAP
jgi:hypothetical protein